MWTKINDKLGKNAEMLLAYGIYCGNVGIVGKRRKYYNNINWLHILETFAVLKCQKGLSWPPGHTLPMPVLGIARKGNNVDFMFLLAKQILPKM